MTEPPSPAASSAPEGAESSVWPTVRRLGPDGRYHLEEKLAAGGAATVWRAYDDHLDRSVAIKILHPHLVADDDTIRRFERESRNAAQLHHPNAIQIYDSGRLNDIVYLVMEFVDGPTLKDVLDDHGALTDWRVVAAIGEQMASALAEAHSQGLIHRDIKPANILFTTEGIVKVVDFGIAKALSGTMTDLTAEGTTVGTATYIAPEQYTGAEVDGRTDVYSLGIVLYECLTGRPAFSGDTPTATAAARLTREVLPPRQIRADVDRRLEDVIVRCTRRVPTERFNDVAAVAHALRRLNSDVEPYELSRDLVTGEPPENPTRHDVPTVDPDAVTDPGLPTGQNRTRLLIALAFLAGMALTVAVLFMVTQNDELELDDALPITQSADYDPFETNPNAASSENPEQVPNSHDDDLDTTWYTEEYGPPLAEIPKPGVGVWYDLDNQDVTRLRLHLRNPGATFSVYGTDEEPAAVTSVEEFEEFWGAPLATFTAEESNGSYPFEQLENHEYWLVWFTELPLDDSAGAYRVGIREIQFLGPTEEPDPTQPDRSETEEPADDGQDGEDE